MPDLNFPGSPTNGQTYTANGLVWTYNTAKNRWTVTNNTNGAIGYTGSQGGVGFTGSRGATGFDGSRGLTGYDGSRGVTGFTGSQSPGLQVDLFYENGQTVSANYTVTTGRNAMSAGPITIAPGITVTVPSGSSWSIV